MNFCPTYGMALRTLENFQQRYPEDKHAFTKDLIRKWTLFDEYYCEFDGLVVAPPERLKLNSQRFQYVTLKDHSFENTFGCYPSISGSFTIKFNWYQWPSMKRELMIALNMSNLKKYKNFFKIHCNLSCLSICPEMAAELFDQLVVNENKLDLMYNKDFGF